MLTDTDKIQLIKAAIDSPSADNSQPFKYHWFSEGELALWIDKDRSGKASDNRYVLSDIALGAVIENINITANSMGCDTEIVYLPDEKNTPLHVANIVFTQKEHGKPYDITLAKMIPKRCTDRRFPFKGPIKQADIKQMTSAAETCGAKVAWYTNKADIKKVLPVIQKAESIRFKSQTLHKELFSTVHFGKPTANEGMPAEVLAIEKPALPFFKLMKKWSFMTFLNKIGGAAMLGFRSVRIPILFSPALALIKIDDNQRIDVIKGGQALQRLWLQATSCGLSIQPYAAPGIFSLGFVSCEPQFEHQLIEVQKSMSAIVNNQGYGLMFLRVGINKPVKHRTNRRNIESFKH
ncbi:hypothetical protein AADZ91_08075 [Colwelliaceae bacterium 6441]